MCVLHLCEVCNLLACSIRQPAKEMQSAEFLQSAQTTNDIKKLIRL